MHFKYIILVASFVSFSEAADILAIVPNPSYSHQIAYRQLWKELSLRGHKVTVITSDPVKDPNLVNLTEIDMGWAYSLKSNISVMAENIFSMWNLHEKMMKLMSTISEAELSYPAVQDLIHNKRNFDVILVEFAYPEFLGFAEIYNCPKIIISSLSIIEFFHDRMGNPSHPVLNPSLGSKFFRPLNFKERLLSSLYNWYMSYYFNYKAVPTRHELLQKYFNTTLTLDEIINDVDMMFLYLHPALHGARALSPTTINIGGSRPAPLKPLPRDLKEFLDSAKDGFIYFSLGSNVKSKELGEETFKVINETLSELPYKILWKFEADDMPGRPSNVKLVKWAPQQDILAHPNIKLFVTQGGLQSLEEGIYSEVPFVVIPFFADQDQNARLMEYREIAKVVGRRPSVQKEELNNAILEVIKEPRYKNAVTRLKQLILDNPMTGLEKAIWWTEYVIRHKGAKHLRNPAADLPLYQYYLLDVIGFLVLTTVLLLSFLIAVAKFLYNSLSKIFIKRNVTKSKKLQ